ncbi:hypothetical protein [Pedococcus sp. 2YAF34]|uniref:hypothetical protein n=1 Tax=Pedococcus sp. 2YAF34 TaxID=3233032 RepID=UPI003F9A83E9
MNYTRLITDLKRFGVKTDETVTEALAVIHAARDTRNAQPIEDLRAAYSNGDITSANAADRIISAATLAAGSERVHLAAAAVEDGANTTLRRWLGAREEQIVKALRPAFDAAAAGVQLAGRHFAPDVTATQLIAAGSAAVAANEGLEAALSTLARIRSCRVQVADCAGHPEQDVTWYIEGAHDLEHLDVARRAYTGAGDAFHALAHAGFTLRLNTVQEAVKVSHGARGVSDAREAQERQTRIAEARERNAFWLNPTSA